MTTKEDYLRLLRHLCEEARAHNLWERYERRRYGTDRDEAMERGIRDMIRFEVYSLSKQLKDRSVSRAEVESGSLYGKEYKGLIFKKTVRKQGVKVISQEGKETYYNSLDTCAANMGYSTKTISGKIHNITKDSYGNMHEFYMYDEDIPYIKAVSYYY